MTRDSPRPLVKLTHFPVVLSFTRPQITMEAKSSAWPKGETLSNSLGSPATLLSEQDLETSTVLQVISGVQCPVLCIPTTPLGEESNVRTLESETETAIAAASGRRANQNRPISE
jgi:hypothetical protein